MFAVQSFRGFAPQEQYPLVGGWQEAKVQTPRGLDSALSVSLRPGDSGSPVLDREGALVGLALYRRVEQGLAPRGSHAQLGHRPLQLPKLDFQRLQRQRLVGLGLGVLSREQPAGAEARLDVEAEGQD